MLLVLGNAHKKISMKQNKTKSDSIRTTNGERDSSLLCQDNVLPDIDSDATSNSDDLSDVINEVDAVMSPRQDHNLNDIVIP